MRVQNEFSRHAEQYGDYNIIQKQVIEKLLGDLQGEQADRILDLGCGSGTLLSALSWTPEHYVGVDFAPRMLELHPKGEHIECIYGDYNDPGLFEQLRFLSFDRIFSASALQWCEDIERCFGMIASLNTPVSLAIFTSGTFETLFKTAGLPPLLRSADELARTAAPFFGEQAETIRYALAFDSTREMFRYIKRSGVSGARKVLDYRATKRLMAEYPLDYLEFEVLFIRH